MNKPGNNRRNVSIRYSNVVAVIFASACILSITATHSANLPDDRADAAYSVYSGGGVDVNGPAFIVRKTVGRRTSVSGEYQADTVSSASIDVITTASQYYDRRDRLAAGIDYIINDTRLNLTGIVATENDYDTRHFDVNVWQDVYGGTGTLHLGFGRSWDDKMRVDTGYHGHLDRHFYRLGLRQLITPKWIAQIDYEAIIDHGNLENPYRSARVLGAAIPERYPITRTSQALRIDGLRRISENFGLQVGYRFYHDTWSIDGHTLEAVLNQRIGDKWLAQWRIQTYDQSAATFFSDNFTLETNYMSRDKELSQFSNFGLGAKVTYEFFKSINSENFNKATVSFSYDFLSYDYDTFTDLRDGQLYNFDAHLFQLGFSLWY